MDFEQLLARYGGMLSPQQMNALYQQRFHPVTPNPTMIPPTPVGVYDGYPIQVAMQGLLPYRMQPGQVQQRLLPYAMPPGQGQQRLLPYTAQPVQVAPVSRFERADGDPQNSIEDEPAEVEIELDFHTYHPKTLFIGVPHPDQIVENSTLAAVDPPEHTHTFALPEPVIANGHLSDLQLECISYACMRHNVMLDWGNGRKERAGFLIGDSTGVGKGRELAGIIVENWLRGRKRHLWVSVSNDLAVDAARDLSDVGFRNIPLFQMPKDYYMIREQEGVLFATYSSLIGKKASGTRAKTRFDQIAQFLSGGQPPEEFDGCLMFDEAHKAKNLGSSRTSFAVQELQRHFPNARVVYCSATAASECTDMGYMERLGLWGPNTSFPGGFAGVGDGPTFLTDFLRRGYGCVELVSLYLKQAGAMVARTLAFADCTFEVVEVNVSSEEQKLYDDCADMWLELFAEAKRMQDFAKSKGHAASMLRQFWAAHQAFFRGLCTAFKLKKAVALAQEAVASGKCAVIGLQMTGEAGTMAAIQESGQNEFDSFMSAPKANLFRTIAKVYGVRLRATVDPIDPSSSSPVKEDINRTPLPNNEASRSVCIEINDESESDVVDTTKRRRRAKDEKKNYEESSDSDADVGNQSSDESVQIIEIEDEEEAEAAIAVDADSESGDSSTDEIINTSGMSTAEQAEILSRVRKWKQLVESLCLPGNPLDEMVARLGGPSKVAELTGRKGRFQAVDMDSSDRRDSGSRFRWTSRTENGVALKNQNMFERDNFQNGDKLIALISDAASSGISLQADHRCKNQRRRVHITLELPWSAEKALQQLGRTHRSNQVIGPEYKLLISSIGGERRFASAVARRLQSMGALTQGDRKAQDNRGLATFNFDNQWGQQALDSIMAITSSGAISRLLVPPPKIPEPISQILHKQMMMAVKHNHSRALPEIRFDVAFQMWVERMSIREGAGKDGVTVKRFLNRLLGLHLAEQALVLEYFVSYIDAVVREAQRANQYNEGIRGLPASPAIVWFEEYNTEIIPRSSLTGGVPLFYHRVKADVGVSFAKAQALFAREQEIVEENVLTAENRARAAKIFGFYRKYQPVWRSEMICLAVPKYSSGTYSNRVIVYKPIRGIGEIDSDTLRTWHKISEEDAQPIWDDLYNNWESYGSNTGTYLRGQRMKEYHMLSGAIVAIWEPLIRAMQDFQKIMGDTFEVRASMIVRKVVEKREHDLVELEPQRRSGVVKVEQHQTTKQVVGITLREEYVEPILTRLRALATQAQPVELIEQVPVLGEGEVIDLEAPACGTVMDPLALYMSPTRSGPQQRRKRSLSVSGDESDTEGPRQVINFSRESETSADRSTKQKHTRVTHQKSDSSSEDDPLPITFISASHTRIDPIKVEESDSIASCAIVPQNGQLAGIIPELVVGIEPITATHHVRKLMGESNGVEALTPSDSSSPSATDSPSFYPYARTMLGKLRQQPCARGFLEEMDRVEFPDYDDVVKIPMDLDIVHEKLGASKYKTYRELKSDLNQMVENTAIYISHGSHNMETATLMSERAKKFREALHIEEAKYAAVFFSLEM